jgi:4-hydroxythreonine-4-phosphate dehydrogenase
MSCWIAIAMGDPTGIGPEVALKALAADGAADENTRFLLIGDVDLTVGLERRLNLGLDLRPYSSREEGGRFFMHNPLPEPLPRDLSSGSAIAAKAAVAWLTDGAQRCLRQEAGALVTAPVNKEAIIRTGLSFVGQTEFLSEMAGTNRTAMMLLGRDDRGRWLRVALATTHVPLKLVSARLREENIRLAIELAAQSCRDLHLPRQRVAVCGLNPHAGEGGEFGDEEINLIRPVCDAARQRGLDVIGPLPADTLFYYAYRGDYDAVVAMYHDQGLAPLKMVAFESGINWTLGLPFVRTSPDHGTAYDIAGKGVANPNSMRAAIRLARQLISKH